MTICIFALQVFTPMIKKAWAFENSAKFCYYSRKTERQPKAQRDPIDRCTDLPTQEYSSKLRCNNN